MLSGIEHRLVRLTGNCQASSDFRLQGRFCKAGNHDYWPSLNPKWLINQEKKSSCSSELYKSISLPELPFDWENEVRNPRSQGVVSPEVLPVSPGKSALKGPERQDLCAKISDSAPPTSQRLLGQCASMLPKSSISGVNALNCVPRIDFWASLRRSTLRVLYSASDALILSSEDSPN